MADTLDLTNIQGDILFGLPKQTQLFYFFQILDTNTFRSRLASLLPLITTAEQTKNDRGEIRAFKAQRRLRATDGDGEAPHPDTLTIAGVNIAFSAKAVQKIGVDGDLSDPLFTNGMKADAEALGDNGTTGENGFNPDWDEAFTKAIDGVILVTGDCHDTVEAKLAEVRSKLGEDDKTAIEKVAILQGDVRPDENRGHEHFGYKDGISQPALDGVDTALPGQPKAPQGVILLGREGDPQLSRRPSWATDGSFLAFRKLPQLVPEFDRFLKENALPIIDPSADTANLLGARLVGRWKSGAPVVKALLRDDPALGSNPQENNNFNDFGKSKQDACPFAAHIRKMVPRGDLNGEDDLKPHFITRRGIPFGPEVTYEEAEKETTQHERGLYFVSYQSDLGQGFHFLQQAWANNDRFPFPPGVADIPGPDAIIGQTTDAGERTITGHVPGNSSQPLTLTNQWVNSKGGEYFFSPSLSALKDKFAASA